MTTDTRRSYGEERYQMMGMIEQRLFVVVYTPRHDALRIADRLGTQSQSTRGQTL